MSWWDDMKLVHSARIGVYEWATIEVRYDLQKNKFFWDEQWGCSCNWWEDPTGPDQVCYGNREQAAQAAKKFNSRDFDTGEYTPDEAAAAYREVRTWRM